MVFVNHNAILAHTSHIPRAYEFWVLRCFVTPRLSEEDIQCDVWPYSLLANHQSRHPTTSKMGHEPSDCRWLLYSSLGVCVGMYWLTYSLYQHPHQQLKLTKLTTYNWPHFCQPTSSVWLWVFSSNSFSLKAPYVLTMRFCFSLFTSHQDTVVVSHKHAAPNSQ